MKSLLCYILAVILLAGCSTLSKEARRGADRKLTIDQVQSSPETYKGRKVIWGGLIIQTENLEEFSQIEVLETELTIEDIPTDGKSRGRFLIRTPRYIDPDIFRKDKRITVVGTIKGTQAGKIGKMNYAYLVIEPLEMKLFEDPRYRYRDMPPPWYFSPYGPYYPYYPWPGYPYRYPYPYPPYYPYP